jgi:replicative DNA helicase
VLDAIGGPVYLAELAQLPGQRANALFHAGIVRDKAVAAASSRPPATSSGNCYDNQVLEGLLDKSEQAIFQSPMCAARPRCIPAGAVDRVFKELEKRVGRQAQVTGTTTAMRSSTR